MAQIQYMKLPGVGEPGGPTCEEAPPCWMDYVGTALFLASIPGMFYAVHVLTPVMGAWVNVVWPLVPFFGAGAMCWRSLSSNPAYNRHMAWNPEHYGPKHLRPKGRTWKMTCEPPL